MAVPVLKLNLAPPSNLWRLNHSAIGWSVLAAGALTLAASLGFTWRAYQAGARAAQEAASTTASTSAMAETQRRVLAELRDVDVAKELPRWRLAERIFTERSLPWSRLTAELERNLAQDVRLKSVQRTRGSDMKVQVKLKGEAKTREAEAVFIEALQKNPFFETVILEREGERQGGGVDFDCTLAAVSLPLAYVPLPKYGPAKAAPAAAKAGPAGKPAVIPGRPGAAPMGGRPLASPTAGRTSGSSAQPAPMGNPGGMGGMGMGAPGLPPGGNGAGPNRMDTSGMPRDIGTPAQGRAPQPRRNTLNPRQRSHGEDAQ